MCLARKRGEGVLSRYCVVHCRRLCVGEGKATWLITFWAVHSSSEMRAFTDDAPRYTFVVLRGIDGSAGGTAWRSLGVGAHVSAMTWLPACRASFGLSAKRFAAIRCRPVADPVGNFGAIEENLGDIGGIKAFGIQYPEVRVELANTVKYLFRRVVFGDIEDHPGYRVGWGRYVCRDPILLPFQREGSDLLVLSSAFFGGRANDGKVGS